MALPTSVTKTEEFLLAIVNKLEEIRCGLIDVETQLEKLNTSPTVNNTIQLDVHKLAEKLAPDLHATLTQAFQAAGVDTSKRVKSK